MSEHDRGDGGMILQALDQLYGRLAADRAYAIAAEGYSTQKIAFAVVLHPDGRLHEVQDVRDDRGRKPVPRQLSVPGQSKPSGSGINPCLLWDNSAYLLGHTGERGAKESEADFEKRCGRTAESFAAFRARHLQIEREIDDPHSVLCAAFLNNGNRPSAPTIRCSGSSTAASGCSNSSANRDLSTRPRPCAPGGTHNRAATTRPVEAAAAW